jgi:hypothetical protein
MRTRRHEQVPTGVATTRGDDRERVELLMETIRRNDHENAYKNLTADWFPWQMALPQIPKLREVSREMQQVFLSVWRETKTSAFRSNTRCYARLSGSCFRRTPALPSRSSGARGSMRP